MAITENLQPKEIEYLKYLKGKGFDAQTSFQRLENARKQGLFGTTTPTPVSPTPIAPIKDTSLLGTMKRTAGEMASGVVEGLSSIPGNIAEGAYNLGADVSKIVRGETGKDTGIAPGILTKTVQTGKETVDQASKNYSDMPPARTVTQATINTFVPTIQSAGTLAGGVSKAFGDVVSSGMKTITSDEQQNTAKQSLETLANTAKQSLETLANTSVGKATIDEINKAKEGLAYLEKTNPQLANSYKSLGGAFSLLGDVASVGNGKQVISQAGNVIDDIGRTINTGVKGADNSILGKVKGGLSEIKQRVETGPQQFIGRPGEAPIISPYIPKSVEKVDVKKIQSLNKAFTPAQKVRNGRVVRPQEKIDEQWSKIIEDFDKKGVKPNDMKDFRESMIQGQKDIYSIINPALKESGEIIDINSILQSIKKNISEFASEMTPSQIKKIDDLITGIQSNPKYSTMDMEKLEELKQFVNAITDWNAKGQEKVFNNFLQDLSRNIGDAQDNLLGKIEGRTSIKDLKGLYGAYSDMLGDVNRAIIKYERKSPVGLFSGLGRIAGIGNLAESLVKGDWKGAVKGGVQIATGEMIRNANDANNIIRKTFKGGGETIRMFPKKVEPKRLELPSGEGKTRSANIVDVKPINLPAKGKLAKTEQAFTKQVGERPVTVSKPKKVSPKEDNKLSPEMQKRVDELVAKEEGKKITKPKILEKELPKGSVAKQIQSLPIKTPETIAKTLETSLGIKGKTKEILEVVKQFIKENKDYLSKLDELLEIIKKTIS